MAVFNGLSVYFRNNITNFDACLIGRISIENIRDQSAVFVFMIQIGGQIIGNILHGNSQPAARYLAFGFQIVEDRLGHIDGNGKTDSLGLLDDCRIDADDFPSIL